ncbi:MAG: tetratricopeptide repeat protein [Candidatus Omnitrophota bacterium]
MTTNTPPVSPTAPSGPPPGVEIAIDLNAIPFNYLKQDVPVKLRVKNVKGYYYAQAHSDLGFNPFVDKRGYSIRYKLDEALYSTGQLFGKCFNLVGEDAVNVPTIEFIITDFYGDTFLDGRISGDQNWVVNENWKMTVMMRLLDSNQESVAEFNSAQSSITQRRFSISPNWVYNGPVVKKMLTDALIELVPKFFTDAKIRTALMASGGSTYAVKDVLNKAEEAEKKGNLKEAFDLYMQSLAEGPLNRDVIIRVIGIYRALKPAPVISEEARKQASYGKAALDLAKDESGYFNAVQEYQKAIRLAPWWVDLYINTALIMEKAGLYTEAVEYLNLYLLAAPEAQDAEKVRAKLYELEYKAKQTGR